MAVVVDESRLSLLVLGAILGEFFFEVPHLSQSGHPWFVVRYMIHYELHH